MELSGRLIYTNGGTYLYALYFPSLKQELIHESPPGNISINSISKMDANNVIFEHCDALRKPNCLIMAFDINTRTLRTLRQGRLPTYMSGSQSIFFYDLSENTHEEWLLIANRKAINSPGKVAKAPMPKVLSNGLPYEIKTSVVEISPDEVVFIGEDQQLWMYQISQSRVVATGIKNCLPRVWRNRTAQLICYDWDSDELYQIDLQTKQKEQLSQLKRAHGLVYVPSKDMLIFGLTSLHLMREEREDIFVYNFQDGKKSKVFSNAFTSSGVWVE